MSEQDSRDKTIIRTSIIGILANVLLAAFKAGVGIAAHSIAIITDAVNNLTDAASSVITIVGTKLAGKDPDREHPFGYGRIEYLSAMIISMLVLYAGVTAVVQSVQSILHPETPDYSTVSLVIVAVAVVVKVVLGRFVKSVGERLHSGSLVNSGEDAVLDSIISASTLVAAVIYLTTGLSLEAWLGAIIGAIIIKSGIEMLGETLSKILGESVDVELARAIKETVNSYPEVRGTYDLVMHNYGPDSYTGSVHVEVPDTLNADDIDQLIRHITVDVYMKHNVILTGISVYSYNTKDPEAATMRAHISQIVLDHPYVLQMHGFYVEKAEKTIRFDIVVSFDAPDRGRLYGEVCEAVHKAYPEYQIQVAMDADFGG